MKITDGGFITMIGGLIIMLGCCGTPRGVNPNDKTIMINPPGAYHNGGLMKTLHRKLHENERNWTPKGGVHLTLEICIFNLRENVMPLIV